MKIIQRVLSENYLLNKFTSGTETFENDAR